MNGDPHIRFYAGMPLITHDGFAIGTLCVIDRQPRVGLDPHERECLELLARETMTQLELRRALKELTETKQALEDVNVELEAFGSAVAHDLRAPVRHIDGFTRLLAEECQSDTRASRHIPRIRNACTRMGEIIDALLGLSRVSHVQLKRQAVDLSVMAREICAELHNRQRCRGPCRPGSDPLVMSNLLSNAWKSTRLRITAHVEFGARTRGQAIEYCVTDNGVGFDPARPVLPPRPFVRHRAGENYEGIGLGLTIIDRIIRRRGGSFRAEGAPDKGAVFAFTLDE